jgi:hypothetical protein
MSNPHTPSDSDNDSERPWELGSVSAANTTPSQRLVRDGSSMPAAVKRRVDAELAREGLTGKRCLIENTDEMNIVHYAHCLARSTKPGVVSSYSHYAINLLEYHPL